MTTFLTSCLPVTSQKSSCDIEVLREGIDPPASEAEIIVSLKNVDFHLVPILYFGFVVTLTHMNIAIQMYKYQNRQ